MAQQHLDGMSVRVQCWYEAETGATRVKVERIDQQEEIQLNDGTFLVRVTFDRGQLVQRCFIRHLASGREAYVQGGPGLSTFIRDSLLASPRAAKPALAEEGEA